MPVGLGRLWQFTVCYQVRRIGGGHRVYWVDVGEVSASLVLKFFAADQLVESVEVPTLAAADGATSAAVLLLGSSPLISPPPSLLWNFAPLLRS